ncbi:response regulator [Alteromonas sp. 1_MG-2023]|uniref:hybrid sensor histidine kinase/response regulator transcription factor n=1 Tax=Alteromonas sp. 1_MG-2023 TaxID=3062669 RepID=UPI0026E448DF|nr:ATP-binding protein [Alteromonas sp. 1_MG-2023]MDO6567755.1 response regulator [Alteromonas sp. 1_MG-2023]
MKWVKSSFFGSFVIVLLLNCNAFASIGNESFHGRSIFAGTPTGVMWDVEVVEEVIYLAAENGVFQIVGEKSEKINFNQLNAETGIISDVEYDSGYLWINEFGVGVFKYNVKTGRSEKFYAQSTDLKNVWNLVVTPKYVVVTSIDGIQIVEKNTQKIQSWASDVSPGSLIGSYSLVSTSQNGVHAISHNYHIEIDLTHQHVTLKSLSEHYPKLSKLTAITYSGFKLYLGGPEGVYIIDEKRDTKTFYPFDTALTITKPLSKIFIADEENIWIAAGGLYKVIGDAITTIDWMNPIITSDAIHSIVAINKLRKGELILASSQLGLIALSDSQKAVNYLNLNEILYQKNIRAAGTTRKGVGYIKDASDSYLLKAKNGSLTPLTLNSVNCLDSYEIKFEEIYLKERGEISFCSNPHNHIINLSDNKYYAYVLTENGWKYFLADDNSILDEFDAPPFIKNSIVLSSGELMGFDVNSSLHIQLSKFNWKVMPPSETGWSRISCIIELDDTYLVCSSGSGLREIDSTTGDISKSKLLGNSDIRFVRAGLLSRNENLWFATNIGLFLYDISDDNLYKLDSDNGIWDVDFDFGGIYELNDTIVIEGDRFAYSIDEKAIIKSLSDANVEPKISLLKVEWLDEKGRVDTLYPIFSNTPFTIDSSYQTLDFSIASNSYVDSHKHKLEFRILGYIDEWQAHSASSMNLAVSDIGYGDFELQVRVQSPKHNVDYPINSLNFKINPPFYLSHYAYFLYALAVIFSFFLYKKGYLKLIGLMIVNTSLVQKILGKYGAKHKNKLEALAENKIRLFSNVSHELRTPLQLILSELGEAKRSKAADGELNITALVHNVQRMENLLDQVNMVDKLGTSTLENFKLYSIDDIKFIASSLDSLVKEKRQVLDISTKGKGSISLLKGSVESIISNLISNAVKFTEKNGVIKFSATFDEENLTLCVKDNGKGIDESNHQEIFKRFARIEPSTEVTGEGIGLSLVKELVTINQGEIAVDSVLGKGSKFTVIFPIDDIQLLNSQSFEKETDKKWEDKPAILLVDDSRELRNHLFKLFSPSYKCLVARNGKQALDIVQNHQVNLVITDLMMPLMGGLNFVKKMRDIDELKYIPIIVLTAKVDDESKAKVLEANVECMLTKPIADEELAMRVKHLVAMRRVSPQEPPLVDINNAEESCILLPELSSEKDMSFYLSFVTVLEKNYHDEYFNRDKAAELLLISPRSLNRKLSELFDYNFSEFLSRYRVGKSKALLADGASVISAGTSVGFGGAAYFSTTFKRIMGIPPKEYSSTFAEPRSAEEQV